MTNKRIIKAGFVNFWRNGSVSFSAVFVLTIALFVIGSTLLFTAFLGTGLKELEDKIDINIYLSQDATETQILDLKSKLEGLPEVKTVTYVTKDQALEDFRIRHKDNQYIFQALDEVGGNPLTAVLNVKAKQVSQYEGISNFLGSKTDLSAESSSIVNKVNYNDNKVAIERMNSLIAGAKQLGAIIIIILVCISVLITFNTIRLAIFIARDEIKVMRLVGGGNYFIRGPFVVEGILYGIAAGIITLILFYPVSYWFKTITQSFYGGVDVLSYFLANFVQIFFIIMLSGIALGAVSSYLAVHRYLVDAR
ncbi:MAG: permease-like cell division protein FtsX [Candidatus Pacebacteria bacterium]|nr:permease-like cell division protein FtsX [Candidatus Paceibacterota bacterium]